MASVSRAPAAWALPLVVCLLTAIVVNGVVCPMDRLFVPSTASTDSIRSFSSVTTPDARVTGAALYVGDYPHWTLELLNDNLDNTPSSETVNNRSSFEVDYVYLTLPGKREAGAGISNKDWLQAGLGASIRDNGSENDDIQWCCDEALLQLGLCSSRGRLVMNQTRVAATGGSSHSLTIDPNIQQHYPVESATHGRLDYATNSSSGWSGNTTTHVLVWANCHESDNHSTQNRLSLTGSLAWTSTCEGANSTLVDTTAREDEGGVLPPLTHAHGILFDVVSTDTSSPLQITSLQDGTTSSVQIRTKVGSYVGSETNMSAWRLLHSEKVCVEHAAATGAGKTCKRQLTRPLHVPVGARQAFLITLEEVYDRGYDRLRVLNDTDGTGWRNSHLTIEKGASLTFTTASVEFNTSYITQGAGFYGQLEYRICPGPVSDCEMTEHFQNGSFARVAPEEVVPRPNNPDDLPPDPSIPTEPADSEKPRPTKSASASFVSQSGRIALLLAVVVCLLELLLRRRPWRRPVANQQTAVDSTFGNSGPSEDDHQEGPWIELVTRTTSVPSVVQEIGPPSSTEAASTL